MHVFLDADGSAYRTLNQKCIFYLVLIKKIAMLLYNNVIF